MGGRGSSSGMSIDKSGNSKNRYGSQYHTILTSGNIKFVRKNMRTSETLKETMTKGRVYVTVGGQDLLQVIYFDKNNKRNKTIDLSHPHKGAMPHTHHGYEHNENDSKKGAAKLTVKERKMVEKVNKIWYDYKRK